MSARNFIQKALCHSDQSLAYHYGDLTVRGGSASTTLNSELWTSRWPL